MQKHYMFCVIYLCSDVFLVAKSEFGLYRESFSPCMFCDTDYGVN